MKKSSLKKLLSVALSVSVLTVPALTLNSSAGYRQQNAYHRAANNAVKSSDLEEFARLLNQLEAETKADKKSASEKSKSSTAKKVLTAAGTVIALGAAGFGAAVLHAKYGKELDWAGAVKNNVVTDKASVAMNWIKDSLGLIDHGCAVNEKWDRKTETCVQKTCGNSAECGEGYACASNKCVKFIEQQDCSSTSDCDKGEICFKGKCEEGTCLNGGLKCDDDQICTEFGTCMNKQIKSRLVKVNDNKKYVCPNEFAEEGDGLLKLGEDVYCVDCSKAGGVLGKDGWCAKNR